MHHDTLNVRILQFARLSGCRQICSVCTDACSPVMNSP